MAANVHVERTIFNACDHTIRMEIPKWTEKYDRSQPNRGHHVKVHKNSTDPMDAGQRIDFYHRFNYSSRIHDGYLRCEHRMDSLYSNGEDSGNELGRRRWRGEHENHLLRIYTYVQYCVFVVCAQRQ